MSLEICPVVLDLVRRLQPVLGVLRQKKLGARRSNGTALSSAFRSMSPGAYSRGKNRAARFQTAAASARETLACLETAGAMGFLGPVEPELEAMFHRVIGTLVRLIEPRRRNDGSC